MEQSKERKFPVTLTTKAIEMVKVYSKDIKNPILRIGVKGGGCTGFLFDLDIIEEYKKNDFQFIESGVNIAIDPISFNYLKGITIDFQQRGLQSGFSFDGGNIRSKCGCGMSVDFN